MSNQRWNNIAYVNVEIYNVVFFNVELNNVRQRRNNVVIFNVNFHNVGQRRNNVANMTIWKITLSLDSKTEQHFWASKNMLDSKFSSIFPYFQRNL